jgi:hypothetical protein
MRIFHLFSSTHFDIFPSPYPRQFQKPFLQQRPDRLCEGERPAVVAKGKANSTTSSEMTVNLEERKKGKQGLSLS